MRRTLLVFRNELVTTLTRFSFWAGALGIPLLGYAALGISILAGGSQASQLSKAFSEILAAAQTEVRIGLVDESGLLQSLEGAAAPYTFALYADEESALRALKAETIQAYASIPADYIATGEARYVQADIFLSEADDDPKDYLESALAAALMDDPQRARLLLSPLENRQMVSLAETPQADAAQNPWSFFVPYLLGMVFYGVTLGTSTTMLNSMSREKSNRMLENLLSAVTPREILTGKIVALGLIGLLQAVLWFGSIFTLAALGASVLPAWLGGVRLPPALLPWSLVLFVLGYFFNASVMAVAGSLADTAREASQVSLIVILPAVIPMMFTTVIIESPHSALALALSFIPPTAPMTLIMRLAAAPIPWWQPLAASLLMALSDYLLIRGAARVFRGQNLLSGGKVTLRRLVAAFGGQRRELGS